MTMPTRSASLDAHRESLKVREEKLEIFNFLMTGGDECPRETLLALTLLLEKMITAISLQDHFAGTSLPDPFFSATVGFELGHCRRMVMENEPRGKSFAEK